MGGVSNYYVVLGLPTPEISRAALDSAVIKRAYHEALLKNHPDKADVASKDSVTVDTIKQAFDVLSNPVERARYDKQLLVSRTREKSRVTDFRTGEELVDLDDLSFDEEQGTWFRSCRCGEPRGYVVTEGLLESAARNREQEVLIGCMGCSLWLRVAFDVSNDEQDENDGRT